MIAWIDKAIAAIAWVMVVVAAFALMAIVGIVMAEVVMRALRTPLIGGIELIRVSFLIAIFFAFAHVILAEREIRVDIIRSLMPLASLRYMDIVAAMTSALFFGFLLWFSTGRLHEAWVRGMYLEGRLLIPMWIPWGTIVLGAAMSVVAALAMIVKYAVRPPQEVDPLHIDERTSQIS